jgi:hypothetical protein
MTFTTCTPFAPPSAPFSSIPVLVLGSPHMLTQRSGSKAIRLFDRFTSYEIFDKFDKNST